MSIAHMFSVAYLGHIRVLDLRWNRSKIAGAEFPNLLTLNHGHPYPHLHVLSCPFHFFFFGKMFERMMIRISKLGRGHHGSKYAPADKKLVGNKGAEASIWT